MAGKQYEVIEMDQFCNAKELNRELITNSNINCDHETINYLKISWLQYRKDDPDHIFYEYEKGESIRQSITIHAEDKNRYIGINSTSRPGFFALDPEGRRPAPGFSVGYTDRTIKVQIIIGKWRFVYGG